MHQRFKALIKGGIIMKKRSKILASLVLAGTMVLGLAGCGDSGSANGGTQSGKNPVPNIR